MGKKIMGWGLLLFAGILFISCYAPGHKLCFDIKQQAFKGCNNSPIINLSVENDSVTGKGFSFEMGYTLIWDYTKGKPAPSVVNLSHIPDGYIFSSGNRKDHMVKSHKLKPNCSYTIEKWGSGRASFRIKIWTDSVGFVYKTTHPKCGLESLESN